MRSLITGANRFRKPVGNIFSDLEYTSWMWRPSPKLMRTSVCCTTPRVIFASTICDEEAKFELRKVGSVQIFDTRDTPSLHTNDELTTRHPDSPICSNRFLFELLTLFHSFVLLNCKPHVQFLILGWIIVSFFWNICN